MRALVLPVVIALTAPPAHSAEQPDSYAVRVAIERQLAALRQDDAQRAFAEAAPQLREQFTDSAAFLRMMQEQFPVIAQATVADFDDLRDTSYGPVQLLKLIDRRGEPWLAFFIMQRGGDGIWRVANVVTVRLPSTPA